MKRENFSSEEFSRFKTLERCDFLTDSFKTAFEIFLSLFACIGIIYLFRDIWGWALKSRKKAYATVIITLNDDTASIRQILEFANFYHDSHGTRYISKIIVKGADSELIDNCDEISRALRIPLEFSD